MPLPSRTIQDWLEIYVMMYVRIITLIRGACEKCTADIQKIISDTGDLGRDI